MTKLLLSDRPAPSLTWGVDWENNCLVGEIDQAAALEQAVFFMLTTERFRHLIYTDDYGNEIKTLLGQGMEAVKARLPQMIQDTLLVDDRIKAVDGFLFQVQESDALQVTFNVHSVYGELEMGVGL